MMYIVSGAARSGTTMMMQALEAGGMKTFYDNERHELPNFNFHDPAQYEGGAVKLLSKGPRRLPDGDYKALFILRDIEDIKRSREALGQTVTLSSLIKDIDEDLKYLKDKMDTLEVWYEDIRANSVAEFERIEKFGFPIDPKKAATVIN